MLAVQRATAPACECSSAHGKAGRVIERLYLLSLIRRQLRTRGLTEEGQYFENTNNKFEDTDIKEELWG